MEDLGIPKELMDDAEAMFNTGFQLVVPPVAEAKRTKGYARWPEVLTVQKAYRELKETEAGDTHMIYAVKCQIMPAGETKNGGRSHTVFSRINYASVNAAGTDDEHMSRQYSMSRGAVRKLKQIAVAGGIDIATTGLSGEILTALFPLKDVEEHVSPLDGKVFKVSFTDNANKKWNDNNNQEIDAWAAVVTEADPSD